MKECATNGACPRKCVEVSRCHGIGVASPPVEHALYRLSWRGVVLADQRNGCRAPYHEPISTAPGAERVFFFIVVSQLTVSRIPEAWAARLVEERWHLRNASMLYDLSKPLECPISASPEPHTTTGWLWSFYVEYDAKCHSRAGCVGRATDTRYAGQIIYLLGYPEVSSSLFVYVSQVRSQISRRGRMC